ncbi:MAG: hypothetical protein CR968_01675 [Flavobacteriia bacterium]|nr:MAG: hypothetical protein CR968_01675 [Flavobacteriia bacterium]
MKKLFVILLTLVALTSCKKKDYAEFTIDLKGLQPQDSIIQLRGMGVRKAVKINNQGLFTDTVKLKKGSFVTFFLDRERVFQTFLNNDFNLNIQADASHIDSTFNVKGKGSQNTKYLVERIKNVKAFNESLEELYAKDSVTFTNELEAFKTKMTNLVDSYKSLDTVVVNFETKGLNDFKTMLTQAYPQRHAELVKFGRGATSPVFTQLRNYKGGTSSLNDFKGQFVYIDLWATWCKPCLAQIPALKELEEAYKGKNVVFVSISTDKEKDYNKWKNMVKTKELIGVQLFMGKDNQFAIDYQVRNIPRFILLDTEGKIFDAHAPRPSEKESIHKLFEKAGIGSPN